jgi:hypothetical protein
MVERETGMRTTMAMMVVMLAASGCARVGKEPAAGVPVAIEGDSIRYATGPCYGTCPVYKVTIRPDGTGTFEGERFTAVTGTREFRMSPDAYRRFAASLEPYRPDGERIVEMGSPDCGPAPTDMPSVDVGWTQASGGSGHLRFYYGCRTKNAEMAKALRDAPALLPIAALIGTK